jgi:Ca2+-binding RTX toxin-like protein/membrane-associated phospholipid phosphatase
MSSKIIVGTGTGDNLQGGRRNDVLLGRGGDDTLRGRRGNDLLIGDSGNDTLFGDEGCDLLLGGAGNDNLFGGSGNDLLDGGSGNDHLDGGTGNDILLGGSGNDVLDGGAGRDWLDAGSGNDTLVFVVANSCGAGDVYHGGTGTDTLRLVLTGGEYANAAVRQEIETFLLRLGAGQKNFHFNALNLTVSGIERLELLVDGVVVTPGGGDTTPPPPPTLALASASDTGISGDLLTADATPTITGTAEAGALVRLRLNGSEIATTTASAAGQWSITLASPLADGVQGFTATATDAAGNTSAVSAPLTLTLDTQAPGAPVLVLRTADDTGVAGDGTTNLASVRVDVAAEAGATVSLGGQSAVAAGGVASFTVTLGEGANSLVATATDAAGNISAAGTLSLVRDSDADAGDDLAVTLADALVNEAERNAVGYVVSGLDADATATLIFTSSGGGSASVAVSANGAGSVDLSGLGDGLVSVSIAAGDAAANAATGAGASLTLDTQAPGTPVLVLAAASDTGAAGDNRTADTTPTLAGTAEAGASVVMSRGGSIVGTTTAAADGSWSFTSTALAEGSYTFSVTATDAAGNTGAAGALSLVIAPESAFTVAVRLSDSDEASAPGAGTTAGGLVSLVGETAPGASIAVTLGSTVYQTVAGLDGSFLLTNVALPVGVQTLGVTASLAGQTALATLAVERVAPDVAAPDNVVLQWIREALETVAEESATPLYTSRALAIQSLAMHDVMAAIEGTPGLLASVAAAPGSNAEAAVAKAAHDVLRALFPGQGADLAAKLAESLATIPDGAAETAGVALGSAIAAEVLARRAGDGWNTVQVDVGSDAPGAWRPTSPMYAPGLDPQWGQVTPFVLESGDQLRPGPPPALDSQAYVDAYNEVKSLGAASGSTRSAEQSEIARFWAAGVGTVTPAGMWNDVAVSLADETDVGLGESARLFAQLNMALADAGIAAWDVKYAYDFWRPVTAIRTAADLGDARLVADRGWDAFIPTPPFPEYVSGHSTYSAAAATILTDVFGADTGFSLTSGSALGVTRSFDTFWDAAAEAGDSRIYGGIHFRFSDTAGQATGRLVGEQVLALFDRSTDTVAPRISLDAGVDLVDDALPLLTGVVSDALSGVEELLYSIDGGLVTRLAFDAQGRFALDLASLLPGAADGRYTVDFFAQDAAGNAGRLLGTSVVLASADPVITLGPESLQPGEITGAGERLSGAVELGEGNSLVALSYSIDGGPAQRIGFDAATGAFDEALDLRLVAPGARSISITATDAAGNSGVTTVAVQVPTLPFTILSLGPDSDATGVGVTYRPVVTFSKAVDPATLTAESFYATGPDGTVIPARIVPFADGLGAWLLFDDALPGASAIRLHIVGTEIRAVDGSVLDADGTGAASGSNRLESFFTVSTAGVPGTIITGIVVDPGLDREMMTPDDVRAGPNGLTDGAGNTWLNPLAGVKVYVLGREDDFVLTDAQGRFTLTDMPAGTVKLAIDGRTATNAPADIFFPEMVMDLTIRPGITNTVMGSMGPREAQLEHADNPAVYLPRLDSAMLTPLSESGDTIITARGAQNTALTADQLGLIQLKVAPGSLVDENGNPVAGATVGIGSVPPSMVMDMLPPGVLQHSFDITIQAPGGAVFTTPAELTLPNIFGAAPGTKLSVLSFDHTTGRLVINGTATVSADGLTATTDPGAGILAPGWHGLTPPGSLADADISTRCPPTQDPKATGADLENAALNVAGHIGTLNDLAGGSLLGESRVVSAAQQAAALRADSNQIGDTMTQIANAWYAGDTGGYGPPDAGYYATMGFKLAGDVSKTAIDAGATVVDYVPILKGTSIEKFFKAAPKVITASETVGTWTSGGSIFQPIKDFEAKVEEQVAQNQVNAAWTPPPTRLIPAAQARLDQAMQRAVTNDALRTPFLNTVASEMQTALNGFSGWIDGAPLGGFDIPGFVRPDGTSAATDAMRRAAEAAARAAEIPSALDDAEAIAKAFAEYLDAIAHDLGMPIEVEVPMSGSGSGSGGGPGDEDTPPVIQDPLVIEYGQTLCYVLENLVTGDEQRGKFDAVGGFSQFLAPETAYKLTVYDPVSKEIGTVVFISAATGVRTHIPDVMLLPDTGPSGPGGLTPKAAFVLGVSPDIADNFVAGVADGTALVTGLADAPQLANVTGVIGKVNFLGDARAIEVEAFGANAATQLAYLATGSHGFALVDVTNARTPLVLAQLDLAGDATDVAVDRDTRLVAVATGTGIAIIETGIPTAPRLLHTIAANATQVEIAGGLLYYVSNGVLTAYDMLGRAAVGYLTLPGSGSVTGLASDGEHLYVLRGQGGGSAGTLSGVATGADGAMTVRGTLTLPASLPGDDSTIDGRISVDGGIVYLPAGAPGGNGGYATIDARDPANPLLLTGVDSVSIAGTALATNGTGRAVTVQQQGIFRVGVFNYLNVVNTANPANTGAFVSLVDLSGGPVDDGEGTPLDVAVAGGIAFVATTDGLTAVQYLRPDRDGIAPTVSVDTATLDIDPARPGIQMLEGTRAVLPLTVGDDVQVRSVEVLLNGTSISTDLSAPFVLDPRLPGIVANGGTAVTLQVRATDTGGNIGLSAPIAVELVPDTAPTSLIGVSPGVNATISIATRKLTYTFSKPLDPSSVGADYFRLLDATGTLVTPLAIELRNGGTRVEVTYDTLALGTYSVAIQAANVRDILGRALGTGDFNRVSSFTVGPFDNVWVGEATGLWTDAANWETGTVPVAGDDLSVVLPLGAVSQFNLGAVGNPLFGTIAVGGAGTLSVGPSVGFNFQSLDTQGITNSGTIVINPRGGLRVNEGDIVNSGRIEFTANATPYSAFGLGSAGGMAIRGDRVEISGGGTIQLSTANTALGANDFRPQINVEGNGLVVRPDNPNIETALVTTLVNVDNTIRGGGRIAGNMYLHNQAAGVIESGLDTRLTLEATRFNFFVSEFSAFSFTDRWFIENDGIIRATASSTLQINASNVLNAEGRLQAAGDNSLLFLTGTTVVTGGVTEILSPSGAIFIENASFVDGAVLDNSSNGTALVTGFVGLSDVELRGKLQFAPQGTIPGGVGYGASIGGTITLNDEFVIFPNATQEVTVSFFRDTIFTGVGRFTLFATPGEGEIVLTGAAIQYPFRENTQPVPDAPPPVRIVNHAAQFEWAGTIRGSGSTTEFEVYDPDTDTYDYVTRPATYLLEIENLVGGTIRSFLNFGDTQATLTFEDMTMRNSGTIAAENVVPMVLRNVTLENRWLDYDPRTGAPAGPLVEGTLAARNSSLLLENSRVTGGLVEVNGTLGLETSTIADSRITAGFGGVMQVGNANGPQTSTLLGNSVTIEQGALLEVQAGSTLELGNWLAGSPQQRSSEVALFGELRIGASDSFGEGGRLAIGSFGGATVTMGGNGFGRLNLAAEPGSGNTPAIVSTGDGGTLELDDLVVAGAGIIGDDGLALVISGGGTVALEAEGDLAINAFQLSVRGNSRLLERGDGNVTIAGNVRNEGEIAGEDADGSFVFAGNVENDGIIASRGSSSMRFEGNVTGFGTFLLEDDGAFIFEGDMASVVTFEVLAGNENARLVLEKAAGFTGLISQFDVGDRIELGDIDFAAASLGVAEDNGQVVLTLDDGIDTATLRLDPGLLGDYDTGAFSIEEGVNGGTVLFLV